MIYVECDADTVLVQTLTGRRPGHPADKGRVCALLKVKTDCIGLVDEDPGKPQPKYISSQSVQKGVNYLDNSIRVIIDSNGNKLIILQPRLEEWILETARRATISLGDYNLPNEAKELHELLTLRRIRRMNDFERLVKKLLVVSGGMKQLKQLLE